MESRQRNGIDGGRTKIDFREFHKLVRAIPIDVFADEEQRQNLIQAVQKALDEAIDIEEEEAWKMSWIDASVDEFCRGMGLDAVDFSSAGRVQLDFEQSGTLHIERQGEQLFLMLSRALSWHQTSDMIQSALCLCHADQGWPFEIKTGLLDEQTLVFFSKAKRRRSNTSDLRASVYAFGSST
ncbi:type III secretion outermembrane negative regulator of secretion [Vibrio sp. JCM 19053]|nr:type III secretion outermembrane negative regulator of secretion [Vibrio sp. JCM 19053]